MQNKKGFLRTAVIALSDRANCKTELTEQVEKLELQLAKVQEFVNSSRITELLQTSANSNSSQQSSAYEIAKIDANEMSDLFSEILKAVESLKRDLADKSTNNEKIREEFHLKKEECKKLSAESEETKTQLEKLQNLYEILDADKKASDDNVGMLTIKIDDELNPTIKKLNDTIWELNPKVTELDKCKNEINSKLKPKIEELEGTITELTPKASELDDRKKEIDTVLNPKIQKLDTTIKELWSEVQELNKRTNEIDTVYNPKIKALEGEKKKLENAKSILTSDYKSLFKEKLQVDEGLSTLQEKQEKAESSHKTQIAKSAESLKEEEQKCKELKEKLSTVSSLAESGDILQYQNQFGSGNTVDPTKLTSFAAGMVRKYKSLKYKKGTFYFPVQEKQGDVTMAKHIENEREFLQEIMGNAILHCSLTNEVLKRVDNFHDYLDFMKVATLTFFNFSHYLEAVSHYKENADTDAANALMGLQKTIDDNELNKKDNKDTDNTNGGGESGVVTSTPSKNTTDN